MQKIIIASLISASVLVSSCSIVPVYKPDIQQGNIITQEMVDQLKVGQSKEQVLYIMGTPMLENNFNPNRWYYVYTFKPRKGSFEEKRLTVYFEGNTVSKIDGISYPQPPGERKLPIPIVDNDPPNAR